MLSRRSTLTLALALAALPGAAFAQTYPAKPVRLLVGFAAGGSSDVLARILAQQLGERMGQQFVVENRPGAGGTIAAAAVAKSPPDGHTLLFVTSGHAGSAALYPKLAYDPLKDFTPVAPVVGMPLIVVVNKSSPIADMKGLVAAAREKPGKLNYGAAGGGATLTSLASEMFRAETGIDAVAVPYKGTAPSLAALAAGELDYCFDTLNGALGLVQSGTLRALAVTSKERAGVLPDVPTLGEALLPGFDVLGWFGVLAPAGTPAPIVAALHKEIATTMTQKDVVSRVRELGVEPMSGSPAEFSKLIETETARWGGLIKRLGLTAE